MKTRVLTGITTTGTPHLGNYVGAIRPAVRASQAQDVDAYLFLADYHALIKCEDPDRIAQSRLEIAATWLAAGLDPQRVHFYRQSDIPEIPELCWLLTCVTGKGLMNRAHAYKAVVDQNHLKGLEDDDGVTMGLFSYPVLMAADILMFNAHKVPVGRDQVQHLEMARDIAQRFNHLYAPKQPLFELPEAVVDENVATLTGLDGRKMSKSYDNTIPLFKGGAKAIKAAVARVVTDSRVPGEPKDAKASNLLPIYEAFASSEQIHAFVGALEEGMGWGDAKAELVSVIEAQVAPMRDRYEALMAAPDEIEQILQAGAVKARAVARPFMQRLRDAVGLGKVMVAHSSGGAKQKKQSARLVQFKDESGQFRFRLLSGKGDTLCMSIGMDQAKDIGSLIQRIKSSAQAVQIEFEGVGRYALRLDEELIAHGEFDAEQTTTDAIFELLRITLQELAD
jgi:tryptophanyl-tRNA synthetase